jgi:hypothetical protein
MVDMRLVVQNDRRRCACAARLWSIRTIKAWMGATPFQMRRLPKVASEMALHVLAYNMKRVMQILGVGGLICIRDDAGDEPMTENAQSNRKTKDGF